jgi:hypothetical protein
MRRFGLTSLVLLALAAWAGAQGPQQASLSAADQLRLHRANRVLLADLVDRGIELGRASHPIDRAEECRKTARALGVALQKAADADDADRVAELGNHLELVVRDGLVPSLDEAKRHIHPMSPDAARLKQVQETAAGDLDGTWTAIQAKLADHAKVKDVAGKLGGLRDKLK